VTAALLVFHGWPPNAGLGRSWGLLLLLAILLPPWLLRRRSMGVWAALILAAAIWGSGAIFPGDWSWEKVGFEYGTRKFDHLRMKSGNNLGAILEDQFGWSTHDPMLTFHLPDVGGALYAGRSTEPTWVHTLSLDGSPIVLDVKTSLLLLYGALVVIAGAGAAMHDRRNDPRILAALVVPWMLMPDLLAQMMNRYEVWAAVLTSMLIAISSGFGLLHIVVSLLAAAMIGGQLLEFDPARSPMLLRLATGIGANTAGVLLVTAAITLFIAVVPGPRRSERVHFPSRKA